MKRDMIFLIAILLACAGVVLTVAGFSAGLLLLVAAILLRPALHECGIATGLDDERQISIHSRSGNVGFLTVILAASGFALWRFTRGEPGEDLLQVIVLGLAARAITNLVMIGEYRRAGVVIISAVGFLLGLFIAAGAGLTTPALAGLVTGGLIIGIGQLGRRFPGVVAILVMLLIAGTIAFLRLYEFRMAQSAVWLLFVMPLVTAVVALLLGRREESGNVNPRTRSLAFGAVAAGAAVVFALLLIVGGRQQPVTRQAASGPAGEVTEIQGIPCTGRVTYDTSGRILSCTLGRDDTLSGQPLRAGTVIQLHPDGTLDWCFLQEDTMIDGHLCLGSGHNYMTAFHRNGRLKTAWLAHDEVIDGIPCAKFRFLSSWFGGGDRTTFHDNGRLHLCTLSAPATIRGKEYRKNTVLEFDSNGEIIAVRN